MSHIFLRAALFFFHRETRICDRREVAAGGIKFRWSNVHVHSVHFNWRDCIFLQTFKFSLRATAISSSCIPDTRCEYSSIPILHSISTVRCTRVVTVIRILPVLRVHCRRLNHTERFKSKMIKIKLQKLRNYIRIV